jgi:hypothetical protein
VAGCGEDPATPWLLPLLPRAVSFIILFSLDPLPVIYCTLFFFSKMSSCSSEVVPRIIRNGSSVFELYDVTADGNCAVSAVLKACNEPSTSQQVFRDRVADFAQGDGREVCLHVMRLFACAGERSLDEYVHRTIRRSGAWVGTIFFVFCSLLLKIDVVEFTPKAALGQSVVVFIRAHVKKEFPVSCDYIPEMLQAGPTASVSLPTAFVYLRSRTCFARVD